MWFIQNIVFVDIQKKTDKQYSMQILKVDRQTVSHASLMVDRQTVSHASLMVDRQTIPLQINSIPYKCYGGQTNYPITDKQYSIQVCHLTIRLQTQKVDIYIFLFKLISLYF